MRGFLREAEEEVSLWPLWKRRAADRVFSHEDPELVRGGRNLPQGLFEGVMNTANAKHELSGVSDLGFFRVGEPVWFRGQYATEFTLRGEVISVGPGVRYGVRLENGNHFYANPNQIRERGNVNRPRKV